MAYHFSRNKEPIRYVSSPCSTGKTHAACKYISDREYVRNHLYVGPSLKLLNETKEALRKVGIEAEVISSETHPKRVKKTAIESIKATLDCGHVLLMTWSAYIDLPYFNRRSNWEIIVDEIPQVDRFYRLMLPQNYEFVTEHLQIFPTDQSGLSLIKAKNPGRIKRLLDGPHDDVHELFRPLFRDVLSSNKSVYVDRKSWYRIAEDHDVSKQDEENTIYFLSMLKPDPLLGAVLLGANLKESLLYSWFSGQGVQFIEERGISSRLRQFPADLGERLRISYFIPGRNISKALSRKEANGGGNLIDRMDELAVKEFGAGKFIYMANNDRDSQIVANAPNVTQAPVVSNGLNFLRHHHNIYFSASLNREPKHFAMLRSLGLSSNLVHQATAHETCYQGVMRTSLRNPASTDKVHAIVPDEPSAERLGELLGCHEIKQIGDLLPRPKTAWSQTERSRRFRFGGVKEHIFTPGNQQESSINEKCCDSGAIKNYPPNLSCNVTFHKKKYAEKADEFVIRHYELHDFLCDLRVFARTQIDSKDELFLWSPATFDPKGGEGYRRQDYFVRSSFLVLDFDDGTLSPDDFQDIFWHKAKRGERHSFVIHNSFSRSAEHPNKFRVILFYQKPAQSIEDHKASYHYVVRRLEEWGHTEESAKLDSACKSGNQSFWIPSINRAHPDFAFFREWGIKTRDLERCAIDPLACPREVTNVESSAVGPLSEPAIKKRFLEKAAVMEAELATMTTGRHHLFFQFGVYLAKGGLPKYEIESRLLVCAGQETKMRKKIRGILKSLEKYRLIE